MERKKINCLSTFSWLVNEETGSLSYHWLPRRLIEEQVHSLSPSLFSFALIYVCLGLLHCNSSALVMTNSVDTAANGIHSSHSIHSLTLPLPLSSPLSFLFGPFSFLCDQCLRRRHLMHWSNQILRWPPLILVPGRTMGVPSCTSLFSIRNTFKVTGSCCPITLFLNSPR